jgi:hypothetical protein
VIVQVVHYGGMPRRNARVTAQPDVFRVYLVPDLNLPHPNVGFAVIEAVRKVRPRFLNFMLNGYSAASWHANERHDHRGKPRLSYKGERPRGSGLSLNPGESINEGRII